MGRFIITEEEKNRILGMHKSAIRKEFLFEAEIKVGMVGTGNYYDTAEGKTYTVIKINDLPCGITEVELKRSKSKITEFAYYKKSEYPDSKLISFRRNGEGVKSTNPCEEYNSFGDFGKLNFSDSNNNSATTPAQGTGTQGTPAQGTGTQGTQAQGTGTQTQGKINTTFDKAYDYKLENGKYYFKGKENTRYAKKYPNWVEATGTGLDHIKTKVTF